jgi:hypothetical protein
MTGYYNTFVVRIWCDDAGKQMRGHIQHPGTEDNAYFDSLDDIKEFILAYTGRPPDVLTGQDRDKKDNEEHTDKFTPRSKE